MRKKLTLMFVALISIAAFAATQMLNNISRRAASGTVTYALSVDEAFTSGQTVEVKDGDNVVATITYGEADGNPFNAAVADSQVEGFTAYTAGNGTNGNKPGGTFYTIKPTYDGSIDVAVVLNADKAFFIEEDGTALADFNGITVTDKYYGTYSFNVSAGKSYKIYCAGSKLGFYGFKYTYTIPAPEPKDVTIAPADGTDISAALAAATEHSAAKGVTVNLTAGASYTISKSIVASGDVVINGNGATIDASTLEDNMIQWTKKADADTEWTKADIAISGVTIKGLKKALFYSGGKYYYGDFTLDNSIIELAGDATTFDYTKGSTAVNFTVTNSTIYASTATTKSLYSSQSGQKTTEWNAEAVQTFKFTGNTMYNLAKTKNFFTHRQNNQKWLTYDVQNNIFVNCGKSGQTIKGLNGGGSSANPTWIVKFNSFNFDGADTSANEATGDEAEPVQDNIPGVVEFADAANGDFTLDPSSAQAVNNVGDPRWFKPVVIDVTINNLESGSITDAIAAAAGKNIIKDLNIKLKNANYTIEASIIASGNVVISGNGATIDASALNAPFIVLDGTEEFAKKSDGTDSDHKLIDAVTVQSVTIKGMKDAFIKDNQKTLLQKLTVDNSVIEMPASNKNFIDFNGKGYVGEVKVQNSTIWAADKNTGFFAQYGSRPKNVNGDWLQVFDVQNSDIINIANGKNVCDLKQNGTAQNVYILKNNIFVDCGKNGQTVVGFNKGQTSATPQWDVTGNTFAWGGVCTNEAEISKAGQKDGADIVQNCVDGVPEFVDAANGDFMLGASSEQRKYRVGDPRWFTEYYVYPAITAAIDVNVPATLGKMDGENGITDLYYFLQSYLKDSENPAYIKLTLEPGAIYTISQPLQVMTAIEIVGDAEYPAMIDARELGANPFVQIMSDKVSIRAIEEPNEKGFFTNIYNVAFKNFRLENLKGQLFYANKQKYLIPYLTVDNCTVRMTGATKKTFFDFAGGGFVELLTVNNSTLSADDATTWQNGGFFSTQSGTKFEDSGAERQKFLLTNNTFYNVCKGKTTSTLRENSKAFMDFEVINNVIVNSGKKGQFVKGLNAGNDKKEPSWLVNYNAFQWTEDNATFEDISESEESGAVNCGISGIIAGEIAFLYAVDNVDELLPMIQYGNYTLADCPQKTAKTGDPRWLDEGTTGIQTLNAENAEKQSEGAWYTIQGVRVDKPSKGVFIHNGKKVVVK